MSAPAGAALPPDGAEVVLIAIVAANRVVGDGADQPWHLREDQRRFLRLTKGHPVVMGRRTWDSIGAPLPGRSNVVLTRDHSWAADGATVAHDPQEALDAARALPGGEQTWIIGGGEVYAAFLPSATSVELTEVDADATGTARFPELPEHEWVEMCRDDRLAFAFVTYTRRTSSLGQGAPGMGQGAPGVGAPLSLP